MGLLGQLGKWAWIGGSFMQVFVMATLTQVWVLAGINGSLRFFSPLRIWLFCRSRCSRPSFATLLV